MATDEETEDGTLDSLKTLAEEAASAHESFKKRVDSLTLAQLAGEVGDLLSLFADLALATFSAHIEHFEWAEGTDEALDDIREQLGSESALLPEDATRLKETILALQQNIAGDPDVLSALNARAQEAIEFIDGIVIEDDELDPAAT